MKIAIITCYRDPDYIRARALRAALASLENVEILVIKNSHTNALRYPEVVWKIITTRFKQQPDVYVLTFRGYEMLPIIRLLSLGKPLIYDELVNLVEWVVYEHKKISGLLAKTLGAAYSLLLRTCCTVILADTASHADTSSGISRIDRRKYTVIPVSTDEQTFQYRPLKIPDVNEPYRVFFYGYMLPLHGPQFVIDAAEKLKHIPNIEFLIAGRIGTFETAIQEAQQHGANITFRQWVPFDELPSLIAASSINIAGPFGKTFQAQHVINGKVYQFLASGSVALIGSNDNTGLFLNHVNCLLVPQGDAEAIAREIQWAYEHQDQLPAIAAAGRLLYDKDYSNKVIAGQLRAMLDKL